MSSYWREVSPTHGGDTGWLELRSYHQLTLRRLAGPFVQYVVQLPLARQCHSVATSFAVISPLRRWSGLTMFIYYTYNYIYPHLFIYLLFALFICLVNCLIFVH